MGLLRANNEKYCNTSRFYASNAGAVLRHVKEQLLGDIPGCPCDGCMHRGCSAKQAQTVARLQPDKVEYLPLSLHRPGWSNSNRDCRIRSVLGPPQRRRFCTHYLCQGFAKPDLLRLCFSCLDVSGNTWWAAGCDRSQASDQAEMIGGNLTGVDPSSRR